MGVEGEDGHGRGATLLEAARYARVFLRLAAWPRRMARRAWPLHGVIECEYV